MILYRLLRIDFICGIYATYKRIAVWICICIGWFIFFFLQTKNIVGESLSISCLDYLLYLFAAEYSYDPSMNLPFPIPYQYLSVIISLFFVTGSYPQENLSTLGRHVLLFSHSRRKWWLSKYLWTQFIANFMFLLLCLVAFVLSRFTGRVNVSVTCASPLIADLRIFATMPLLNQVYWVVIVPLSISLAIISLQLYLSLHIGNTLSFLGCVSFIFISAYYTSPYLIGNLSMLRRVKELLELENKMYLFALIIPIGINLLFLILGTIKFGTYDVMGKGVMKEESS